MHLTSNDRRNVRMKIHGIFNSAYDNSLAFSANVGASHKSYEKSETKYKNKLTFNRCILKCYTFLDLNFYMSYCCFYNF